MLAGGPVIALIAEPSGKVVVSNPARGDPRACGSHCDSDSSFQLSRFNADGSPDTTFGSGGRVSTRFEGASAAAVALVRQADGKTIAAGSAKRGDSSSFALARYSHDGSLDPTFGSGGRVETSFGRNAGASELVVQPDRKVIVGGWTDTDMSSAIALARYEPDGSLDRTFGIAGRVTTPVRYFYVGRTSLHRQGDGRLVFSAENVDWRRSSLREHVIVRYLPSGSLDPRFGRGGKVTAHFVRSSGGVSALQRDGSVVMALNNEGTRGSGGRLVRFSPAGALDRTFGTEGSASSPIQTQALLSQPDGKIVAGGAACRPSYGGWGFGVARFARSGRLDPTFGTRGTAPNGPPFSCFDDREEPGDIMALALAPGGRLLAGGDWCRFFTSRGAIARYYATPIGSIGPISRSVRISRLRSGLGIEARCAERCRVVSELILDAPIARRLRLGRRIGRGEARVVGPGNATVRVTVRGDAIRRLERLGRLSATLRTAFIGAPLRPDVVTRRIELKR